jgi:hypothetical protein
VVFGLSFQVLPGFFIVAVDAPQFGSVESPGFGVFLVKDLFELPEVEGAIPCSVYSGFILGVGLVLMVFPAYRRLFLRRAGRSAGFAGR